MPNAAEDAEFTFLGIVLAVGLGLIAWSIKAQAGTSVELPTGFGDGMTYFLAFLSNFAPFSLFAYGFVGDVINGGNYRLAIPSVAALVPMLMLGAYTLYLVATGALDLTAQNTTGLVWCTIPGLEHIESPYIPTAFIATSTILLYYFWWSLQTYGHISTGLWAGALAVIVVQVVSFFVGECRKSYTPFGNIGLNIIVALFIGVVVSASTFGVYRGDPTKNPFNISMTGTGAGGGSGMQCPNGGTVEFNKAGQPICKNTGVLAKCPDGSVPIDGKCPYKTTGTSQQVQGGGDENTFVAELYKNGQLVTDSIAA